MKSIVKNIAAAFALIVILFAGCKNPAEDVEIIVSTDIFKSPTLIQFVNAKEGLEGPKSFTVEITGPNASLVRTTTGDKVFKTAEGYLNLMLDRTANPTPNSPVKFTIIANATGFAPTYQDVVITSETDPVIYRVAMTEYANPVAGSGTVVATKAITNGTSTNDVTFTTTLNAGTTRKSDVIIPTGTGFLDAGGQPVGGSQLEAQIVHSSTAASGRFANLPGGGFASNVIGANGQPIAGGVYFKPAGSVSITMSANGKEVKSFTKPITIDMEVNPSTVNPTTKQAIKENETIPLWSLNTQTGQWKNEGNATLVKNSTGILLARAQITHLSDWAFCYPAFVDCSTSVTITRTKDDTDEFFNLSNFLNWSSGSLMLKKGEKTKIFTGPSSSGPDLITISAVSDKYVQNTIESSYVPDVCGSNSSFNFVEKPDLVAVDLDVKFKCSNKDLLTGINSFITVTPIGASSDRGQSYFLKNGKGSGTLVNGVTYKITAQVGNMVYVSQFTADKTNTALPANLGLTGTVVYDATTNSVKINALVIRSCD